MTSQHFITANIWNQTALTKTWFVCDYCHIILKLGILPDSHFQIICQHCWLHCDVKVSFYTKVKLSKQYAHA